MNPSARPRLLVTDLDGTLLGSDGEVSAENSAALARATQAGIITLIATGRPPRLLGPIRRMPGPAPLTIACNGALLYDPAADRVLASVPIDQATAVTVAAELRTALPGCAFAVEHGDAITVEAAYRAWDPADNQPLPIAAATTDILTGAPYVKLLVQHTGLDADRLADLAEQLIGDRLTVTHSAASGRGLLEISAPGVSKATMLKAHCRDLGIAAAEVAAFGDMPNDLEMLRWSGRPYAMADAHPAVLSCAEQIGSNDASAVGRTILSWWD